MAKTNVRATVPPVFTHEGGKAYAHTTPEQMLRRSVLSTLLWEDNFYENGVSVADRIMESASKCSPEFVSALAIEARNVHGLRHAPLLLLIDLIKRGGTGVAETIAATLKRADEPGELLSLYWQLNVRKPLRQGLSAQLRKGLALALSNFDEYQLAKYDRDATVKLRDVLRLSHAKPKDEAQAALFKAINDRALATPDTWEVSLSRGANKAETFTRLLTEGKLGYLALLRNLRGMSEVGVSVDLIRSAILARKGARMIFPYRYLTAARIVPMFERELDKALLEQIDVMPPLAGRTIIAVDTSGSMESLLSDKSVVSRGDAAATLSAMINGDTRVIVFGDTAREIASRRGIAGADAIKHANGSVGHGTNMDAAVRLANSMPHDRLILISDEQTRGQVSKPIAKAAYMINVANFKNGVGYGDGWTHIDGFSEATIRYIQEIEQTA